jgi:Rps23 Pro-64 3,4-dihydroxylase Tpa1-like proline 4-hydroxylase
MNYSQLKLREIAELSERKILSVKKKINFFESPYKHLFIDNFFPNDLMTECLKNFPDIDDKNWIECNDEDIEIKYRTNWKSEFDIPEGIINVVRILNSSLILNAMSKVMGIKKIIPDPYFTGGGLNMTKRSGLLDVHVDGNYHDATGLHRRLNAILYLNPGWNESWGGEFGVYNETGDKCIKKIAPLFNRLVIFDTHDKSFHGLPEPINFPNEVSRKSIILYYYTKDPRPSEHVVYKDPHSALWKKRNLNDKKGNKKRKFF